MFGNGSFEFRHQDVYRILHEIRDSFINTYPNLAGEFYNVLDYSLVVSNKFNNIHTLSDYLSIINQDAYVWEDLLDSVTMASIHLNQKIADIDPTYESRDIITALDRKEAFKSLFTISP